MARHNINLRNYEWYGYVVEEGGGTFQYYFKKGLYRLDRKSLSESFAEETAEEFAKNLQERLSGRGILNDLVKVGCLTTGRPYALVYR